MTGEAQQNRDALRIAASRRTGRAFTVRIAQVLCEAGAL
jgi:hypothetical protein